MAERVVLHVGLMKTGTTYLQSRLARNADELSRAGVVVAGDRGRIAHDLFAAADARSPRGPAGAWDRWVARARSEGEVAVLSHEMVAFRRDAVVRRVAEDLADRRLDVVVTVRDARSVLPSQWQTQARNRGVATWPEYAEDARAARPERGNTFVRSQRLWWLLDQWQRLAPQARLVVVTVPGSGAGQDALWDRFAGVLGVAPTAAPRPAASDNVSLGYATAHLLVLLHRALPEVPAPDRRSLIAYLARHAGPRLRAGEGRPTLDAATQHFCAEWNDRALRAVDRTGAELVGDPADLPTEARGAFAQEIALPPDDQVLTATGALSEVLAELAADHVGSAASAAARPVLGVEALAEQVRSAWQAGLSQVLTQHGRLRPGPAPAG